MTPRQKREQQLRQRKLIHDALKAELAADRQPENKRDRKRERSEEFRRGQA
jgi:ribosomal protein L4